MGEFSGFALVPEQGAIPQKHQLDPDMQRRIEAMAARVDIRDNAAVMGFGARAQKEMGTFSDIALEQMLRQDIKPLESVMQTLAEQIKSCSFTAQAKGLFRRVFGGAAPLAEVQAAYEKAIPRINACADEMTDRRVALMRDSALLDRLYERNEGLYRELCSLIVVGDEVIAQARARGDKEQDIARMERRVQDLRITQVASTQLAAQIRAVQAKANQGTLFGAITPHSFPVIPPAKPPEPPVSEEEEDNNDPYGEFIDFPEECRAKDPCQNMYRETLF